MRCQRDNEQGYKWGDSGFCYIYKNGNQESKDKARNQALKQGLAIGDIEAKMANKLLVLKGGNLYLKDLVAGERLGTAIERKRKEMNLSMEEVADQLPIRVEAYKRIEYGYNNKPPDDIIEAIAKVLKLNADELKTMAQLDYEQPVDNYGSAIREEYND